MIYLRTNRNNVSSKKKKLLSFVGVGIILISIFFFARAPLQSLSLKLISPVLKFSNTSWRNVQFGLNSLLPDFHLARENEELKKQINDLKQDLYDLKVTRAENENLRERLGINENNLLSAAVLLSPPRTPYDSLIIDRGEYDGVALGQKVLLGGRVVLGVIDQVYGDQSQVKLFSSPGLKSEVWVERTGTIVEIEGQGSGNFKLEAPKDIDVQVGDTLVLPGQVRRVVATVAELKVDETSSFATAYLQVPLPLLGNSLIYVEVPSIHN